MSAELLTPEEVGKVLRVSDQTVVAMCKKEELQHAKVGKQYRIFAQQLADKLGWTRDKLAQEMGKADA
ncbi:helix-turn-helix domain-containing protein [Oscillochloris sp. ZM17-4]|uniref:helix-turn-helix domain-containing protein n=1 Tax=Oscillochloris sp. ZM17-4 TaxID=2866714 RepID=UPI002105E6B6|nr:helix-turn-helix domain-containing protein [Oscillochloris sp. ZM17-4]